MNSEVGNNRSQFRFRNSFWNCLLWNWICKKKIIINYLIISLSIL